MKSAENLPKVRTISRKESFLFAGVSVFSIFLFASGCGGGGGGGGTSSTPTPAATPTPTATPTPVSTPVPTPTPVPVPSVNLTWNSADASSVAASNFGATGLSGTLQVTPTVTTAYSLSVTGLGGQQSASFTVNVATVAIGISPSPATVVINKTLPLAATVTGAVDTSASWSVQEPGSGTVTQDANDPTKAVYLAPAQSGVFHVTAVSNADPSKTAIVEIKVQAGSGNVTLQ